MQHLDFWNTFGPLDGDETTKCGGELLHAAQMQRCCRAVRISGDLFDPIDHEDILRRLRLRNRQPQRLDCSNQAGRLQFRPDDS